MPLYLPSQYHMGKIRLLLFPGIQASGKCWRGLILGLLKSSDSSFAVAISLLSGLYFIEANSFQLT